MNIGDLKNWIKTLPDEFNDMALVYRTYDSTDDIKEDGDSADFVYALDAPISSGFVDEQNREVCLLNDKSTAFIVKMNEDLKKGEQK